jgi:DegV family protein with EDD domain
VDTCPGGHEEPAPSTSGPDPAVLYGSGRMPTRVALVTDSTAEVPPDLAADRGIHSVPTTVTLGGQSYRDGVDITAAEFYEKLGATEGMATTSQPSVGEFAETYERLLADHDEVLSLHISADMSGTIASAQQAAEMVGADRVTVVDSRMVSMALGLLVLAVDRILQQGATAAEARDRLVPIRDGLRVYFVVGTLEYLRRGGRIGRASALLGSMLQVKPVLTLADGVVAPLERVRTAEKALGRVIDLASQSGSRLCAAVGHADTDEQAGRIAAALRDRCESLIVIPLGPSVGAHGGPGTVGLGCYPADLCPLGLGVLTAADRS